jgi:hypothetical protein
VRVEEKVSGGHPGFCQLPSAVVDEPCLDQAINDRLARTLGIGLKEVVGLDGTRSVLEAAAMTGT